MAGEAQVEILIVEDSPTQAQLLKHILEQEGFAVMMASQGREALDRLRERRPALVLSDINMPEMDGYQLCLEINGDQRLRGIPVVLVTSLTDPQDVIHGLECGAVGFASKPYQQKTLVSLLRSVLANRSLYDQERQLPLTVNFAGASYRIASSRPQILSFLLSTYESAMQKNEELSRANLELQQAQEKLARLARELEALSIHDELTGLYNRRGFHALAEHQMKIARRAGSRLMLCYADLDGMKQINDIQGHEAGDRALVELAGVLKRTGRASDLVARLGGDEFVVLGFSEAEGAPLFRERLERNLALHNELPGRDFFLSLSMGFAWLDADGPAAVEAALKIADEAMYQEKMEKKRGG